ncbi:MAG: biopolymer transporter ExbD [Planctomycetaceae bacterium]|nr:biopolymer transporter ExbD [Planctomycetaceae bacterium]
MKIRGRGGKAEKMETPMSAMIDVVFQLLIFFMLTLKIIEPEGNFDINMPLGAPQTSSVSDADLPPFKVRMEADPATGELCQLFFNNQPMCSGPPAFQRLNMEILKSVNALQAAGPDSLDKQEVEIDPDFRLKYKNIIAAISACSGAMVDGKMVRYIKKIKFAPIREDN